jgi:PAS domain S-box-containing protein
MSPPRVGRVAKKVIVGFQKRYNRPDGSFGGVISAPVELAHFDRLIAQYDLGTQGSIVLRDNELRLITRYPPLPPDNPAGALGNTLVSAELHALVDAGTASATYHTNAASDRLERIISLERSNVVPMFVLAGVASKDYLAGWNEKLRVTGVMVGSFILLSLLFGIVTVKLIERLVRELEEREMLEAVERRRRASHQRLNEIAANTHQSLAEQFRKALAIGAEHLGLEFAIFSHVVDDSYTIVSQISPPGTLQDGQTFPLGDTYCSITLARNDVVSIADWGVSDQCNHPCYRAFKLEAYIGAPVLVEGQTYGTVNFSSPRPYVRVFDDGDREFIRILARWIGAALERDQALRKLAESETRLRTIIDTEPECVKIVAPDGTLLQMNQAGLDMIEADNLDQVAGRSILGVIAPEWRDAYITMHQRIIAGEAGTLEYQVCGLRGGRRWLETHGVPLRDADGHITGQLAVTRDINFRKENEAALLEAMRQAEAANVAKSRFLATMSHEIRTPMNGILGMAQLLLMPELTDEERLDYARVIMNSGKTLLTLLNDILDLSKIEAGRVDLESLVFDPAQVIDEIARLFAEQAMAKGLRLEAVWHGAERVCYRADPVRLRQMLSNLVSNAIKFTVQGFVRIEGRVVETTAGEEILLEFAVSDSGIGIPADKQPLLFKPFTQVDASTTRRYGGTGLGLSIVRNLAKLMGGSVGIESEPDHGARIWFRIRAGMVKAGDEQRSSEREAPIGRRSSANDADRSLILIAEDNPINRKVVETLLRKQGLRYESVENGNEVLDRIISGALPDLVLMDCQMPVMDGFEATRRIREWEKAGGRPRIPIVALTADVFAEDRERCNAAGMDDFLAKPLNVASLTSMLDRWLG